MAKAEDSPDDQVSTRSTEDEHITTASGDPLPYGVKLGSTRTVVAHPDGDDVVLSQTLTCLTTYGDALTGEEQYLFGEEAAEQYPEEVEFPLRSGLPEDDERAELAATFFNHYVESLDIPEDSVVVYAVPTIDNKAGIRNLEAVIERAAIGERSVRSYPESLCGAIPALGDGLEAIDQIFLAVNLGSTNLEACAYRHGEHLLPFATGAVSGNEVDRRIASNVEEETQGRVNVDVTTAREYKETHADFEAFEPFTDVIQQPGGGSHEFTIEDSVMDAVDAYLDEAVEEVANTFLPQLANDNMKVYQLALDRPIVLTGGMACIPGIVEEFESRLGEALQRDVDAVTSDRPDLAATLGAQRIASKLASSD